MTQPPSGDDPVVRALDELVRSGQLAPERARAAYDASRGADPSATRPMTPPPKESGSDEPSGLRFDLLATALGTALVATTIVLASFYARSKGDLDWSNYGLGLFATLGLLAVAAGAYLMVDRDERKAHLVAWPGALGALGAGLMIGVAMDDSAATGYVAGLLSAALSAAGFFLVRRAPFVVSAILGLFVGYASLVDDLFDVGGGGDNLGMTLAAALLVYAIAVTAGGWPLPTRDVSGVFVGALTVVGLVAVLAGLMATARVEQAVAGLSGSFGGAGRSEPDRFHNDVYLILLFTLVLMAGWLVCGWLSGHVGYRILVLVAATTVVPLVIGALLVEHPSYWSLGCGIVGAGVLGVAGMRALGMLDDFGRREPPPPRGPIGRDR